MRRIFANLILYNVGKWFWFIYCRNWVNRAVWATIYFNRPFISHQFGNLDWLTMEVRYAIAIFQFTWLFALLTVANEHRHRDAWYLIFDYRFPCSEITNGAHGTRRRCRKLLRLIGLCLLLLTVHQRDRWISFDQRSTLWYIRI